MFFLSVELIVCITEDEEQKIKRLKTEVKSEVEKSMLQQPSSSGFEAWAETNDLASKIEAHIVETGILVKDPNDTSAIFKAVGATKYEKQVVSQVVPRHLNGTRPIPLSVVSVWYLYGIFVLVVWLVSAWYQIGINSYGAWWIPDRYCFSIVHCFFSKYKKALFVSDWYLADTSCRLSQLKRRRYLIRSNMTSRLLVLMLEMYQLPVSLFILKKMHFKNFY